MAFATTEHIAARIGRDLTSEEQATQVPLLLELATNAILDAVDKTQEWAEALDEVPPALSGLCIELVARVLLNPAGGRSISEQIGQHSRAVTFGPAASAALTLTDAEERRARRAVYGSNSGSAPTRGIVTDLLDNGLLGPRYHHLATPTSAEDDEA